MCAPYSDGRIFVVGVVLRNEHKGVRAHHADDAAPVGCLGFQGFGGQGLGLRVQGLGLRV